MTQTLSSTQEQTIALAAIMQAAELVYDIAENGKAEPVLSQALINSLFVFNPESTLSIYNDNLKHLSLGLDTLAKLSNPVNVKRFNKVSRYAVSLVSLEKDLAKQTQMLEVIRSRLKHVSFNQQHFIEDGDYNAIHANLSGIYQDTISTLRFRIQVTGNMSLLTQSQNSDHIRSLLFAGVRAAMLWRQLGGSRWHLVFKRGQLEKNAQQLLEMSKQI